MNHSECMTISVQFANAASFAKVVSLSEKIIVTITTIDGDRSTVTLSSWSADHIHAKFGNLNRWVQSSYDQIVAGTFQYARFSDKSLRKGMVMSQRAIGDAIRERAEEIFIIDTAADF